MATKGWAGILFSLATVASCGGGVQMGNENEEGESGAAASGGAAQGGTQSTGKGGTSADGGSAPSGQAGEPAEAGQAGTGPEPEPRCGFEPASVDVSGPFAAETTVYSRISLFLQNVVLDGGTANEASAAWASDTAEALLAGGEAAGLSRFLETWLNVSRDFIAAEPFYADVWAEGLSAPDATLATLLSSAPTSDPQRMGILTDQQLLSWRPNIAERGAWLYERLFCGGVPPAPIGLGPVEPPQAGETRRAALTRQVAGDSCISCHEIIDPPGWALEHFDASGSYRDTDNGERVDASGTLVTPGGEQVSFDSIDDLAPQLAGSCEVALCFARTMMNHAFNVTDPAAAPPYSEDELNSAANRFADADFSVRELFVAIVQTPSFLR